MCFVLFLLQSRFTIFMTRLANAFFHLGSLNFWNTLSQYWTMKQGAGHLVPTSRPGPILQLLANFMANTGNYSTPYVPDIPWVLFQVMLEKGSQMRMKIRGFGVCLVWCVLVAFQGDSRDLSKRFHVSNGQADTWNDKELKFSWGQIPWGKASKMRQDAGNPGSRKRKWLGYAKIRIRIRLSQLGYTYQWCS